MDWFCGGGGGGLGICCGSGERGGRGGGEIDKEGDGRKYGLEMAWLRNCQGRGAAHTNRLQGLAISKSRKVVNSKVIAMHSIRCSCT